MSQYTGEGEAWGGEFNNLPGCSSTYAESKGGVVGIAGCLASEMGKIQNLSGYARSFYCGGIA